jgi:exonuclease SbcC
LINKVTIIDVNISNQKTSLKTIIEEIDQKTMQKNELAANIVILTNSVITKQKEQENANLYLNSNQSDALLITEMGAISASLNNLMQTKTSLGTLQTQMNKLRGEWDSESKKLTSEAQKIENEQTNLKRIAGKVIEIQETINFLLNNRTLADYRNEQELLTQKLMLIREIESLEQKRRQLEDNKECPLCGALHHPYAEGNIPSSNDTELRAKELNELIIKVEKNIGALALAEKEEQLFKNQVIVAEAALKITQNNIAKVESIIALEKEKEQHAEKAYNTLKTQILTSLLPYGIESLTDDAIQNIELDLKNRLAQWKINTDIKDEIDAIITDFKAKIVTQTALLLSAETSLEAAKVNAAKIDAALQQVISERKELYGFKNTKAEEARLEKLLEAARNDERRLEGAWKDFSHKYSNLTKLIEDLKKAISDRKTLLQNLETAFQQLLSKANFDGEAVFIECRLPKEQKDLLSAKEKALDNKKLDIESRKKDRNIRLAIEEEKKLTELALEILVEQSGEIGKGIEAAKERKITIAEQLRANNEGLKKIEEVMLQINIQKTIAVKWGNLSTLIGSADGKKFRNFAQGLTFEIMVSYANKQLTKLTDRYLLIRDKEEPLNLNVIDNYQAGECRSTKNLSGGESFYISLALALGLSSMSSKNVRVDSLFLDEGFGTLDEETLEIALETLASLRQDGKLIGVISHVSSLKDRINTKIEVVKGTSGNSLLVGAGCERLA